MYVCDLVGSIVEYAICRESIVVLDIDFDHLFRCFKTALVFLKADNFYFFAACS